jgi:transmembrane sensor
MTVGAHLPDIRSAAAAWVVRMHDPDASDEEFVAFDRWLDASPDHRRSYDEALATWLDLGQVTAVQPAASQPRRTARRARDPASRRRAPVGWMSLAGLAASAALVVAIWPLGSKAPQPVVYATQKGERRSVVLADGSHMDLNAATRVSVQLGPKARRVVLEDGEVAFDVTHDASRPFTVATRAGRITDLGTEFNIRQRGDAFSVTVRRGVVEVQPRGALAGRVRLTPGQRFEHRTGDDGAQVRTISADDDFSWRTGRLVLRHQSLAVLVEDLNFYFPRPIRIADPKLVHQTVSGVLVLDNEDATLRRLALLAPLKVVPQDGDLLLKPAGTDR